MSRSPSCIEPLVIHIRLTKGCNADCSYCSSWELGANQLRLSPDNFKKSLDYVYQKYNQLGNPLNQISMQYLGGEVLIIPKKELYEIVTYSREYFEKKGIDFRDGVQSNLIGSPEKVEWLYDLFEGRVGTSIDTFGTQRTVNKSAEKYKNILEKNEQKLISNVFFKTSTTKKKIPAIFTMDDNTYKNGLLEYNEAKKNDRNLTLKAVFNGGRVVNNIEISKYTDVLMEVLEDWFLNGNIIVEPLYGMLGNYIENNDIDRCSNSGCHFQNDCAKRSVAIDPNGDIYVCQDMADMGKGLLGNAINNQFNEKLWEEINNRTENLHEDCKKCEYLKSCRGGCMATTSSQESIFWGKAIECDTWKEIFKFYEKEFEKNDITKIKRWYRRLGVV